MRTTLKVVSLIDPHMCLGCRFGKIADVEAEGGRIQRMIRCTRLDCDNWDRGKTMPLARIVGEWL